MSKPSLRVDSTLGAPIGTPSSLVIDHIIHTTTPPARDEIWVSLNRAMIYEVSLSFCQGRDETLASIPELEDI